MTKIRAKRAISVVLASASERRKTMLKELGIAFKIQIPMVLETPMTDESPEDATTRLALAKAQRTKAPRSLVIGMDTMVVTGYRILGKPANPKEALSMLRLLSGKVHRVVSGLALLYNGKQIVSSDETQVHFRKLTDAEIQWYVKTGEPFDKAGAYAIQGKGRILVTRVEGCYYNVVGFPLSCFQQALGKLGLTIYDLMGPDASRPLA